MQSDDVIDVLAPLGGEISKVSPFRDPAFVVADAARGLVAQGRTFRATVQHQSSPDSDVALLARTVEIPVIGSDGEIAGVLYPDSPPTNALRPAPLKQHQGTAIMSEATKTVLHDVANLLSAIEGGLQLLERRTEVEGSQPIVDRMRHAVQRGAVLSRKLLGGNRTEHSAPRITTRRDLVAAAEDLRHAVGPGRSLRTEIAKDLSDFATDREALYFALLNLCRNANAALRDGGEVVISAKNVAPSEGASTGIVEIIVADNGSGMTDEVLRRAFDENFTTKPDGQGSGLGLGQVRKFVQKSGGTVEIMSKVGVGTAVRILLAPV